MRICRYRTAGGLPSLGFYREDSVIPMIAAANQAGEPMTVGDDLLAALPHGREYERVQRVWGWVQGHQREIEPFRLVANTVEILVPVPRPPKLLLLAGNYAKHVVERGGRAEERSKTFPYVFMKPPSTTLQRATGPVIIPRNSPDQIDWEVELGVVIGKRARHVTEDEALQYVAGYTVVNDISDRNYQPNPERTPRERDKFFDWLHGKWHDASCPMGPCILAAGPAVDPQQFSLELRVNDSVEQSASTAEMVFPVAAVIAFLSEWVTLEPGDILSTGTPAGVGSSKGKFLQPGDLVTATIAGIGSLQNPVVAEGHA